MTDNSIQCLAITQSRLLDIVHDVSFYGSEEFLDDLEIRGSRPPMLGKLVQWEGVRFISPRKRKTREFFLS